MAGGIYLVGEGDDLVEMKEQPFDAEDVLQTLLARYPNLLAGDQIDSDSPRRWLLVDREVGVPDDEYTGDRWSIDHLFLDQDGIPTLVEVKRSSDTRLRREVVGQMLDYAANAVSYWPVETIKAKLEARCNDEKKEPEEELLKVLENEESYDDYWNKVKTNLQAGKIRMLFVADSIPSELRRVIDFLNEQMDPAEVLALEIKQYVRGDLKTFVPRVFGQSEQKKTTGGRITRDWDEETFFKELEEKSGDQAFDVGRKLFDWAKAKNMRIEWGKGRVYGCCIPVLDHKGRHTLFDIWTNATMQIRFQYLAHSPPFDIENKRREILDILNKIEGVNLPENSLNRFPNILLEKFSEPGTFKKLMDVFDWMIDEIKAT